MNDDDLVVFMTKRFQPMNHLYGSQTVASLIRQRREALGLSREELGVKLANSRNLLRMLEEGHCRLTVAHAFALARLLHLDEELLLERTLSERRELAELHAWLFGSDGRLRRRVEDDSDIARQA